ncbi:MAG: diacylglycerol kinase family protein [Solobacterium sp.]|nr:diacylglycerol kinase family protein [Solobacterium sp.]
MKKKFLPAFEGIITGFEHRSIALQFLLGLLAVIAGIFLKLSSMEWIAVIICIGLVISAEFLNTAIEFLCDFITESHHPAIKEVKDLAAAGVLITAGTAFLTAMVILIRHI